MSAQGIGPISVSLAPGELLDRITILRIKSERAGGSPSQRDQVRAALARAEIAWARSGVDQAIVSDLVLSLSLVNGRLWDAEDQVRECERRKDFGEQFVSRARAIMQLNDQRAALRQQINARLGLISTDDVKIYAQPPGP